MKRRRTEKESKGGRWRNRDQESMAAPSSSLSLPSLCLPFLSPLLLPPHATLSPLSCSPLSLPPLSASPPSSHCALHPPLPHSPARSCSIWEGLPGLASLQCRGGQGVSFSTMLWRMVHQEKRVYQVCGLVFVCVSHSEGEARHLQVDMVGIHHGRAAVDESDVMDECDGGGVVGRFICDHCVFTCPQSSHSADGRVTRWHGSFPATN